MSNKTIPKLIIYYQIHLRFPCFGWNIAEICPLSLKTYRTIFLSMFVQMVLSVSRISCRFGHGSLDPKVNSAMWSHRQLDTAFFNLSFRHLFLPTSQGCCKEVLLAGIKKCSLPSLIMRLCRLSISWTLLSSAINQIHRGAQQWKVTILQYAI